MPHIFRPSLLVRHVLPPVSQQKVSSVATSGHPLHYSTGILLICMSGEIPTIPRFPSSGSRWSI